jgi:hypothetical protein
MATEESAGVQPQKPQGAAKRNFDKLAQKMGLAGGAPAATPPGAGPAAPAPRASAPAPLSAAQALAMAGKLMELDFNEFEAEAKRLLAGGQGRVLKALASSRPDFEQNLDVLRKWARSAYAAYLVREMTDDARWQVARLLNDRLLLWVETRSERLADELRTIRREIGF